MKQTKIVASISDRRCGQDFIRSLYEEGMNVVRINTAHASEEGIRTIVANVRAVSSHIGILLDTKGPEVRTTACDEPISYKTGDVVKIFGRPEMNTTHDMINVTYADFASDIREGCHILFDDGALDMAVIGINGPQVVAQVTNDGVLGSRKSVNVPGVHIDLPTLTDKDRKNIMLAIDLDLDFIAHSFVRSAADVRAVQAMLDAFDSDIKIISKIENQEGVDNIDEIISKCVKARKPVIVATQMLHTMISNPRPTRAEVTDIANAIYYNTDALMLSGETASGKYPVEAVRTMSQIAEQAERDKMGGHDVEMVLSPHCDIREFMAYSAIEATEKLGVKGIITDSATGDTARNLAAFRGPNPVLAICYRNKLQRWLNLSYGVIPVYQKEHIDSEALFHAAVRMLRQKGYVNDDDKIAYLSGNVSEGGGAKFLEVNTVREVFSKSYQFHIPKL